PSEMPRSAASAAARRTISPTISLSSGVRSFSDGMWRLGMTRMCVGPCGLMSLNASTRSSSYTTDARISRVMILQNRQSCIGDSPAQGCADRQDSTTRVPAALGAPGDRRARDALQIPAQLDERQLCARVDQTLDLWVLA